MTILEALILGIIQGLTEFLPVSSSGHIELGAYFLNVQNTDNLLFTIVVHGATALSTIVVFRADILELLQGLFKFKWNESTQFAFKIVISMIPVTIIGIGFEDQIEILFTGKVLLVAGMLAITGFLLLLTYFSDTKEKDVSVAKAFVIGIAQAIAIFPGISRSGSTIATGLLLGVNKGEAARFSFLMVLPPILGATLLKAREYFEAPGLGPSVDGLPLFIGFVAAFISGLLACRWMISLVKRGKLIYFAIYCFVVSGTVLILSLL